MNAAGSPLYRARFQWQPTLTSHDPDNILTLENAPVVYTVTGSVALTFEVASDVDFGDTQDADVAITFAVSSPLAVTFAEAGDVALTFGVEAGFEYVAGSVEEETSSTGGHGGGSGSSGATWGWARPPRRPVTFEFVGSVAMPKWKVAAVVYGPQYPTPAVMVDAIKWATEVRYSPAVTRVRVAQLTEEEELLLVGAL